MKKSATSMTWLLAFALAAPARSAYPASYGSDESATAREVQRLQEDVDRLDEDLDALAQRDPAAARRLKERADAIREDTGDLRARMRRHQEEEGRGTGVSRREVAALADEVRDLRNDIDDRGVSGSQTRRAGDVRLPEGTEISVRLAQSLSSANAATEDRFRAEVERPVRVGGEEAIPEGAELRGVVRRAVPAERGQKAGRLELEFDSVTVDGRRTDLRATLISMGNDDGKNDVKRKAGVGAAIGGVVGGLLKGRTGAIIGVLVGGGAVVAQRGQDVELPEGTILRVRLERAMTVAR
jgi:hypothetical protein